MAVWRVHLEHKNSTEIHRKGNILWEWLFFLPKFLHNSYVPIRSLATGEEWCSWPVLLNSGVSLFLLFTSLLVYNEATRNWCIIEPSPTRLSCFVEHLAGKSRVLWIFCRAVLPLELAIAELEGLINGFLSCKISLSGPFLVDHWDSGVMCTLYPTVS